jgi:hypothetical protein
MHPDPVLNLGQQVGGAGIDPAGAEIHRRLFRSFFTLVEARR